MTDNGTGGAAYGAKHDPDNWAYYALAGGVGGGLVGGASFTKVASYGPAEAVTNWRAYSTALKPTEFGMAFASAAKYSSAVYSTLSIHPEGLDLIKSFQGKDNFTIEGLITNINNQEIGYKISGSELGKKIGNSAVSLAVSSIEKVKDGLMLNLTFMGRRFIGAAGHQIDDGSTFSIKTVKFGDGSFDLNVSSKGMRIFKKYSSVYIKGNSYSFGGKMFSRIL